MAKEKSQSDKDILINTIRDTLHLTVLHYGLWFNETEHQLGLEKAIAADALVWDKFLDATIKRLSNFYDTPLQEGPNKIDKSNLNDLRKLADEMSKNWVACDGMWFQTIEQNYDNEMFNTKRINDSNWVRFSNIEANIIMRRLNLPRNGGLTTLKEALAHRQYLRICKYELEECPGKLVLRIKRCRVQETRRKKGLTHYICKSSGMAEYSYFAEAIDPRIRMRCLYCPPDSRPEGYWCAWEFTMDALTKASEYN